MAIKTMYQNQMIDVVIDVPIDDSTEQSLEDGLIQGAMRLNQLINEQKCKVFVHCTSSSTRGPSVALVYLCLYIKDKNWRDPELVAKDIKMYHKPAFPNMKAVNGTIATNKDI